MKKYYKYLAFTLLIVYILITNIYASSNTYKAKVNLLTDKELLQSMINDILDSKKNIYAAIYMFKTTDDRYQKSTLLEKALIKALKNGTKVFIVMELGKNDDITTKFNKETAEELISEGAKVVFDSPKVKTHAKIMVIDENITYIGSHNYTHSAFKYNHEATARIVSKDFATDTINYIKGLVR